jgi:hypothetical protein
MSRGESRERRVVQWGETRMLLDEDLVMIRPQGTQGMAVRPGGDQ